MSTPSGLAGGYTPTNTAPTPITLGAGPAAQIPPVNGSTSTPPTPISLSQAGGPTPLPPVPGIFRPAFTSLTGGSAPLDGLTASAADIGAVVQGIVNGERTDYEVRAGTDATGPGIVRPANFNASTNAVVFVQRA